MFLQKRPKLFLECHLAMMDFLARDIGNNRLLGRVANGHDHALRPPEGVRTADLARFPLNRRAPLI